MNEIRSLVMPATAIGIISKARPAGNATDAPPSECCGPVEPFGHKQKGKLEDGRHDIAVLGWGSFS